MAYTTIDFGLKIQERGESGEGLWQSGERSKGQEAGGERPNPKAIESTKKKGRQPKEAILCVIKQAFEDYISAYMVTFENVRNQKSKEFREKLKSNSRSNKIMQFSLGQLVVDEQKPGIHKLSKLLRGDSGLFLTNMDREEVQSWASGALDPESTASHDLVTSVKRGVWAMIVVFLAYSLLQATST